MSSVSVKVPASFSESRATPPRAVPLLESDPLLKPALLSSAPPPLLSRRPTPPEQALSSSHRSLSAGLSLEKVLSSSRPSP